MADIHDLSAVEQAERIRRRELSPVEIARHYLDRVAAMNDQLGAFVTVTENLAIEQAESAERRLLTDTPEDLPPLFGVPVPIKDLDMVAGVRWTWGSEAFADQVAPIDEVFVAELRAAGAVFLGKTNTPEFGLPCYTENDIAPPARTPWDLDRSAGGSSGGAAAAVAAGLAPVAQGSDGGGSIRIPASVCGLFGLKPTRGRVTTAPVRPDLIGLSTTGPLARTVADAAALLDTIAVSRPGDYYTAPPLPQGHTFRDYVGRDPGRLRIARFRVPPVPDVEIHADVLAAYESTSRLLAELGHDVVDLDPPFDGTAFGAFEIVWAAMATRYPVPPAAEDRLRPLTRWLRERGARLSATQYLDATTTLQALVRSAMAKMEPYDVVLNPTLAMPPVPVGYFDGSGDPADEFVRMTRFTPFTTIYNVSGQPAVNVPLHVSADGLPIGTMLAGRMGGEPTLIALSAQLEAALPWRDRTPPIWTAARG